MESKKDTLDLDENKSENNLSTPDKSGGEKKEENNKKHIKWSPENENIMVEWCDVAQCYKWLNARSHAKYAYMHAWFTIPAITLSTISGTASFAQASLPLKYQTFAPMVIGTLNIFIGILTTLQQYLKISELNESHRVASISWDKFARNIRIELSKEPDERSDAGQFIKYCRQEFDRLMETSPSINETVINEFTKALSGSDREIEKQQLFKELKKPDICNTIISADRYRHPWYIKVEKEREELEEQERLDKQKRKKEKEFFEKSFEEMGNIENQKQNVDNTTLSNKLAIIEYKEQQIKLKELEELEKQEKKRATRNAFHKGVTELAERSKAQTKILDNYVIGFNNIYGRNPLPDEIIAHIQQLGSSSEIDENVLNKFLKNYN